MRAAGSDNESRQRPAGTPPRKAKPAQSALRRSCGGLAVAFGSARRRRSGFRNRRASPARGRICHTSSPPESYLRLDRRTADSFGVTKSADLDLPTDESALTLPLGTPE